jgi:hypothetical protein
VILAAAAAYALATPSREALLDRWRHANPAHLHRVLEAPQTAPEPRADLRALAQRELSTTGRYQLATPMAATVRGEPWWVGPWTRFRAWWSKFWHAIFAHAPGRETRLAIGDVLIALVALVLIVVVVRLVRDLQIERARSNQNAQPLTELPDAQTLYRRACDAAARGDYGGAALLLFAATIALLDKRGAIALTSSATVGDLRRDLRARDAALLEPFDTVAAPFVQRAYADRVITPHEWEHAQTAFVSISQCHPEPVEG